MKQIKALAYGAMLSPGLVAAATDSSASVETRIRRVVGEMLQAKDRQISNLERRLRELEQLTKTQQGKIRQLEEIKTATGVPEKSDQATADPNAEPRLEPAKEQSPLAKFLPMKKTEPAKKPDEAEDTGPKVGGFLDVTAQTKSNGNQIFHLGVVELDLDRIVEIEHFAASAALDWFPYGTTPNAQIGAGFVDFHLYDNNVPVRGRIFQEPGFHLQAGQFDLPFASDYQFFAVKDRLTVTPPVTTVRVQQSGVNPSNGGFNSTGVRAYGSWSHLNYAAYWTDSVYGGGTAIGGRLGLFWNNPYRLHKRSDLPILDVGVSGLLDLDKSEQWTDTVYAADLSFNYANVRLLSEFLLHDSNRDRRDGNPALNEYAFHVTGIVNLDDWLKHPMYAYGRYQQWKPRYDTVDVDGAPYAVTWLPSVSVGLGYRLNDYLTFKLEYTDSLGRQTAEPGFQRRMGIAQLVASF